MKKLLLLLTLCAASGLNSIPPWCDAYIYKAVDSLKENEVLSRGTPVLFASTLGSLFYHGKGAAVRTLCASGITLSILAMLWPYLPKQLKDELKHEATIREKSLLCGFIGAGLYNPISHVVNFCARSPNTARSYFGQSLTLSLLTYVLSYRLDLTKFFILYVLKKA